MPEPQELLDGFAAELEAGNDPDPREWVARADEDQRQELARTIDRYLMAAPRRAWDPVAYETSLAKVAVDQLYESIEGVSGSWPELLPRLRNRARIKRSELVERLAGALGVGSGQAQLDKVGTYYHRMEHGLLPAEGVSQRVIVALAGIVGASAEAIRSSGGSDVGGAELADAVYARLASPSPDYDLGAASPGRAEELDLNEALPARDEIDELFTGG